MQQDEDSIRRLKEIAAAFNKDPMDPLMREMFGDVKKQLILAMISTGVTLGLRKGQEMTLRNVTPSTDNLILIVEATAKEVYSMKETELDIIFTI